MNPRLEKIEVLRQKLKQLEAQQQAVEAREKVAAVKKAKVEETRRKILLGAFLIDSQTCPDFGRLRIGSLVFNDWLTRPNDRALFSLASLLEPNTTQIGEAHNVN